MTGHWRDWADCANVDPELWYPERGQPAREARAICRACPVRVECLEDAVERGEEHGIWGGLTEKERRRLRRLSLAA